MTSAHNDRQSPPKPRWVGYVVAVVAELALTAGLWLLMPDFPLADHPITYVLLIMIVAYVLGEGPAVLAFVLGIVCFGYAFPPDRGIPRPEALLEDRTEIVAYLIGAAIVGIVAIAMRRIRNRAELFAAELRGVEGRYRLLIETMNEGFATNDADYVFTYANPRFAEMLGYDSPDEVVGHHILEFLDEDNRTIMRAQIAERRSRSAHGHYELTWITKGWPKSTYAHRSMPDP